MALSTPNKDGLNWKEHFNSTKDNHNEEGSTLITQAECMGGLENAETRSSFDLQKTNLSGSGRPNGVFSGGPEAKIPNRGSQGSIP